eukprot:6187162-Pleurochrysis_carterae.AAC.2
MQTHACTRTRARGACILPAGMHTRAGTGSHKSCPCPGSSPVFRLSYESEAIQEFVRSAAARKGSAGKHGFLLKLGGFIFASCQRKQ